MPITIVIINQALIHFIRILFHLAIDVASEEGAVAEVASLHHRETPRRRVNHHVAFIGNGGDELALQVNWLPVGMVFSILFFYPKVRDGVIFPYAFGAARRLLQDNQVFALFSGSIAHSHALFVPSKQIHGF